MKLVYFEKCYFWIMIVFLASVDSSDVAGKIATYPACKDDVTRLCSSEVLPNDLAVLDCLQNRRSDSDTDIKVECHSFLWQFKLNLTKGDQFLEAAEKMCSEEFKNLVECSEQSIEGHKLSCLLENSDSVAQGQCKAFLVRIGSIIFSDFRLVERFTTACHDDIAKFNCGRLDSDEERDHKQGSTIECLSEHVRDLTKECHLQTLRVAELQADDYHLDRPLFLACRDDRERFCRNAQAGQGRVYKCLVKNKMQSDMSNKCRKQLVRRQQLVSEDYKVSKGLVRACKEEIVQHKCFKDSVSVKDRKVKLAQVLLCLENALHAGSGINGECQAEMLDHRRQLLEDFRLSPEVVYSCQEDIKTNCRSKEIGGKTLHCLMKHSRKKNGVSDTCLRALEDLIRVTDAGSDWQVDSLLKDSCSSVVETACKSPDTNQAGVVSCLMDKVFTDVMTTDCRTALLEIQYFVARDFRLDTQLYTHCKSDATQFCYASPNWTEDANSIGPQRNPLVLPCLYRYAFHPPDGAALKPKCIDEVRRVMRQRANSVDLIPEVEEPCIQDLATLCFEKTGRGEEMQCLQDNLEKLSPPCKVQVSNYTEEEAEHIELNPFVTAYCSRFLETHCQDELDEGDEGQVMECLIEYKMHPDTTMNSKCRAAVEHFQLIAMQDFRFSGPFKRACKLDIARFCPNVKAKPQVVSCLSEMVRNDTVAQSLGSRLNNVVNTGSQHRVSQPCRQQLRNQLLQQHEDVQLNPNVRKPCALDEKRFCSQIKPGQGRILACLKAHRKQLEYACHSAIFQAEREEMDDSGVDFQLVQQCKDPIRRLCQNDVSKALECLKSHIEDSSLESNCKQLVLERMASQNLDIRFNPELSKACSLDIPKFCLKIWQNAPKDRELEGQVVDCLKQNFIAKKSLTQTCSDHLTLLMEQQALHYQLDPVLVKVCDSEIKVHCDSDESDNRKQGEVEECLKRKFDSLSSLECRRHIALLITAVQIDIQADPLLHRACAIDLVTFCKDVPPGEGRRLKCLLRFKENGQAKFDPKCHEMLAIRTQLFAKASEVVQLESVNDLVEHLSMSPARNFFLILGLSFVGFVLMLGIVCGRVTKRNHVMKNR